MQTIEEAWVNFQDELAMSLPDSEGAIAAEETARALAKASFQAGWAAGCGWDDDLDAENSEVDMDALLLGEAQIEALGK